MLALALIIVIVIVKAGAMVRDSVVAPLVEMAGTMNRMASGDYTCTAAGSEREGEIGMMASAIAVLRCNGQARQVAEAEQQAVGSALSTGLERMARKDLEYRDRRAGGGHRFAGSGNCRIRQQAGEDVAEV